MPQSIEAANKGKQKSGIARSTKWPAVRRRILKGAQCAACGSQDKLRAHHVESVTDAPHRELDETNIIVLCESGIDYNCHLMIGHNGEWQQSNPFARQDAEARQRELSDRPSVEPRKVGVGGSVAEAMLSPSIEGMKDQRLCERALLNESFEISPAIQRGLVSAMAQVALDAEKYDARRRNQAALTLAKFQTMRVAELEKREEFRLREKAIDKGEMPVHITNVGSVGVRETIQAMQQDPDYVDYLNSQSGKAARLTAPDGGE